MIHSLHHLAADRHHLPNNTLSFIVTKYAKLHKNHVRADMIAARAIAHIFMTQVITDSNPIRVLSITHDHVSDNEINNFFFTTKQ